MNAGGQAAATGTEQKQQQQQPGTSSGGKDGPRSKQQHLCNSSIASADRCSHSSQYQLQQ